MRWQHKLAMQVQMVIGRRKAAIQLDEELQFHLERQIDENQALGMTPDEARRAALRSFGNPGLLRAHFRAPLDLPALPSS
jgi:putative ABC transport system permease protein